MDGTLLYKILPGSPEFSDVAKGDEPEPTYLLELDHDICITGDSEFADPRERFSIIHLLGDGHEKILNRLINQRVHINIAESFAAHTGHHHAPLVVRLENISPDLTVRDEGGSAIVIVRGFYLALRDGSGEEASQFIVPERRNTGPFSSGAMSRFYGNLKEPLQLIDVRDLGPSTYTAHYRYQANSSVCHGRAEVTTTQRDGRNYILRIRALDGC